MLSDQEEYENVVLSSTSEEYQENILIFEDSLDEVHRERSEDQAVNESNVSVEGSESEAEDKEVLDAEKIISELQSDLEESGRESKEISLPGSINEEQDQFQMGPPCCTQNLADEDIFLEQGEGIYDGDIESDAEVDSPGAPSSPGPDLRSDSTVRDALSQVDKLEENVGQTGNCGPDLGQCDQELGGAAHMESTDTMADSVTESDEGQELVRPPLRRSKRVRQRRKILTYPTLGEPRIQRYPFLYNLEVLTNHNSHS